MKLQKTLKVKIGILSKNKQNILDRVIRKNIKAINFCLQKAKKGKNITHNLVYKDLRKLNLPATIIHGARAKSVEIIKSFKKRKGKKTFPILKNGTARYDNRIVKILQQVFRAICSEEQASINNASDLIDPEPQAKKGYSVRNNLIPPMSKDMGIFEVIL